MVAGALRDEGYDVVEAFSGDEAIAILADGLALDLIAVMNERLFSGARIGLVNDRDWARS